MMKKLKVALLFGGKSAEHEVSLVSAKNVYEALDKEKYDVVLIGIDKKGQWKLQEGKQFLLQSSNPKLVTLQGDTTQLALVPKEHAYEIVEQNNNMLDEHIDIVFPLIHGPYGEDGSLQGLLKLANIPYVGAGVLGSAIGMDKDVMKRLLKAANIPVGEFLVFTSREEIRIEEVIERLGLPLFVKPANMGSSIGVTKVKTKGDFHKAIDLAFEFDTKILIEKYIKAREVEVSVLGNENPIVSIPGEIIVKAEFYTYEAKYINEEEASLDIPAKLTKEQINHVQDLALKTYKTLCCEGMARVDFFLDEQGVFYVREINTIPGFTKRSMYPALWEASGIPYQALIDRLIQLAIERHQKAQTLITTIK